MFLAKECLNYQLTILSHLIIFKTNLFLKYFFYNYLKGSSMSSMTFGQKIFKPTPPDKGSFPLDHEGICKTVMVKYMKCLREKDNKNSACREEAREYLDCRMQNNLMAQEEWSKLGFPATKQ